MVGGKGEQTKAGYQPLSPFPKMFSKVFFFREVKIDRCVEKC